MPVQYTSIVEEHNATRRGIGLFDVSHMGRLRLDGPGAGAFLDRLLTRRVADMPVGRIRYSLMCQEDGGILDDVLAYHLTGAHTPYHFLVVNASNRDKIVAWLNAHLQASDETTITDVTRETAMIAVQGPHAIDVAEQLVDVKLRDFANYSGADAEIFGARGIVSRTGYTGEDGCELIVPNEIAATLWQKIIDDGQPVGARAVGLGARDTLRLEAAMPLYGHELNEQIDPFTAGLDFAVNLANREFIGKAAIAAKKADATKPVRVGLEVVGRRVPREHFAVLSGDRKIGEVTSGTFSPLFDKPLAMAYVEPAFAAVGTPLTVDIRGAAAEAKVVPLPFYKRSH